MPASSEPAANREAEDPDREPRLMVPLEYVPRKAADVLELDMGDGIILYNRDSDLVHHLNPTAGILWQLFAGEASIATLATEISEEWDLDLVQAQQQLRSLAAELDALGLVQDTSKGRA
jgi:hypothetical protein